MAKAKSVPDSSTEVDKTTGEVFPKTTMTCKIKKVISEKGKKDIRSSSFVKRVYCVFIALPQSGIKPNGTSSITPIILRSFIFKNFMFSSDQAAILDRLVEADEVIFVTFSARQGNLLN